MIECIDVDECVDDGIGSDILKYFYYVKKDKIVESVVMGSYVVVLCGEVFFVICVFKLGLLVCFDCKWIYDIFKKG